MRNLSPRLRRRLPEGWRARGERKVASVHLAFHLCRRNLDRVDNVRIRAAPAQVAGHKSSNLAVRTGMTFVNAGDGGHDLPGSAITALQPVTFNEGSLYGMQFIPVGQTL